jgi:DTW domain-containing protein YfiP/GNAT superfamily N-acetyltransferase
MKSLVFLLKFTFLVFLVNRYADGLTIDSSNSNNSKKMTGIQTKIANSIAKAERRAQERKRLASPRNLCNGCHRPPVLCVCKALPEKKFETNTTILILQHPNEFRKKTFSTVPLIPLVLENVQVKVGYDFNLQDLPIVEEFLGRGGRPLLLFPSEEAISLEDLHSHAPDVTTKKSLDTSTVKAVPTTSENLLIVLDGTWAEAKRMALQSPELVEVLQHVTFSAEEPSRYDAVRKEPEAHCYSTLEACAQALILLEHSMEASKHLANVLDLMVQTKLDMEASRTDDPRQNGKKTLSRMRQRERIESALFYKQEPRVIDENGTLLRSLTVQDAEIVNQNWYHPSQKSLSTIEKCLENGLGCFGIEYQGKLLGQIVRGEDGCLGMLRIDEEVRGRGYGKMLLQEAAAVIDLAGLPQMALIRDGNIAAESLFRSVGWTTADDNSIKHEGRQRRRWVPKNKHE